MKTQRGKLYFVTKGGTGLKGKLIILLALSAVPFIMVLGNSMLIPVLPEMQKQLGISQFQASLVISLFSVPAGIIIPFAGFLSDRLGRKIIIVPSLIIYGLGGLVAGLSALIIKNPYWFIIAGRIIQGVGAAGTAPVTMALVGDMFINKERSKALGYIEASNGMGKVISPVLGSLIALVTWYATFFVFPVLTFLTALAVWFLVKEPSAQQDQQGIRQYFGTIKNIFSKKAGFLITAFLAGSLSLLLLFGILFFLSDFLELSLKLFGVKKGLVLAIPVLAMSSTSFITGTYIKKQVSLMKKLVIIGLGTIALSLGVLPLFKNPWFNVAIMSVAGIGVGLILPCLNTLITSSTSTQERGMVTSLYGSVRFLGVAAGPPLFGLLTHYGRYVMFWSSAGAVLAIGVLSLIALPAQAPPHTNKSKNKNWQTIFMETITFKNTIGHLVTRKPLQGKNQQEQQIDQSNPQKNQND